MGQWLIADLFSLRYSLPGLGVPGSGYRAALVPIRFGNVVVFAEISSQAWAITKRQCARIPCLIGSARSSSRKWHHT
jgi:hypothetical protein